MKLWGGRFDKDTDEILEEFGASIHFDQVLWQDDIIGSIAHVQGLLKAQVITQTEADKICAALKQVEKNIAAGNVQFNLSDEDIHMNIERLLFQEIGELAGKIHTGRSRNDQVALDMRLYMRRQLLYLIENCCNLQNQLILQAKNNLDVIIPGYTHLQRAQPVRLAHHFLAYVSMFARDIERLQFNYKSTNKLPLGAGAIAGNSFSISQEYIAELLNFDAIYCNSIDAVSDRDYLIEFLSAASLIMMHLSKLCEELILWSSQEFSFIELDDAFCTGSSMMPQKKNPDAAELVRGKTGRVYGALMSMLTFLKGLPLAYNKDLQEDKEGVFDTIKTVNGSLIIMTKMIATLKVNKEHIAESLESGFLSATEIANYLVKKGMTFRRAHETVGKMVKYCFTHKITLSQLDSSKLEDFSNLFDEDVISLFYPQKIVEYQTSYCGTAKNSVLSQIDLVEQSLNSTMFWIKDSSKCCQEIMSSEENDYSSH